jgi:hypothetical protein
MIRLSAMRLAFTVVMIVKLSTLPPSGFGTGVYRAIADTQRPSAESIPIA